MMHCPRMRHIILLGECVHGQHHLLAVYHRAHELPERPEDEILTASCRIHELISAMHSLGVYAILYYLFSKCFNHDRRGTYA